MRKGQLRILPFSNTVRTPPRCVGLRSWRAWYRRCEVTGVRGHRLLVEGASCTFLFMPSRTPIVPTGPPVLASRFRVILREWLPALLLVLPATLPYFAHFAASGEGIPTGFIQGDQAYYMANAREHFDSGSFSFFYGNPFDGSPETPRVYWQPHILVLGLLLQITGLSPGILYILFGICGALICARVALAMLRESQSFRGSPGAPLMMAFFWGGGLLVVAAAIRVLPGLVEGEQFMAGDLLRFDPGGGWWFLNFGRNLVFPTEAYYHALFFGCIVCILRRSYAAAALCAAFLSASHPFTGLELLAVMSVWLVAELIIGGPDRPPAAFVISVLLLLLAHISYYLVFLPSIPEHRQLMDQWEQPWVLPPWSALFAYAPVAAIALWSLVQRGTSTLRDRNTRLLLVWFAVAFILANHQYILRSVQPLHFTRGYVWTPLFLLAAPALQDFFQNRRKGLRALSTVICVVAIFVVDNAVWLGLVTSGSSRADILLTADQRALLDWTGKNGDGRTLLLTGDVTLGYLATVYTPVRAWVAHRFNTPRSTQREREVKEFMEAGGEQKGWKGLRLIVITARGEADRRLLLWRGMGAREVENRFTNASFDAVLLGPIRRDSPDPPTPPGKPGDPPH